MVTGSSFAPPRDKTNKMICAPSEDSDQPGHPPSLIRVFIARMKKAWVLSCPLSSQRRLWSDWADAQADLSLHWAHSHCVCFVLMRLIFLLFVLCMFYWSWTAPEPRARIVYTLNRFKPPPSPPPPTLFVSFLCLSLTSCYFYLG